LTFRGYGAGTAILHEDQLFSFLFIDPFATPRGTIKVDRHAEHVFIVRALLKPLLQVWGAYEAEPSTDGFDLKDVARACLPGFKE
jgi:hypothetical protein